jgi:N-acetylmuramoyl-L-alanine amidase
MYGMPLIYNKAKGDKMIPTHLVIHHSLTKDSQTVSWDAIRWYHVHTNGWNNIGYHFGIEFVNSYYEILSGRMMTDVGAHCKEGGMNSTSLGICVVGNFDLEIVPSAQMDRLVELTRSLQTVFKIPASNVKRHTDYASEFKGRIL